LLRTRKKKTEPDSEPVSTPAEDSPAEASDNKEVQPAVEEKAETNNNYAAGAVVDLEVGDPENSEAEESEEEEDEEPEIGVEVPIPTSSFQNIDFTVFRENEISEYENTPAYVRKNVKINVGNYKGGKYQKFQLV